MIRCLACLAALALAAPAVAEECRHQPEMMAFADDVLTLRPELGRFRQRAYGAEAVYLQLRYGGIEPAEAAGAIADLIDARVRDSQELGAVFEIATRGLTPDLLTGASGLSGLRAALIADPDLVYKTASEAPERDFANFLFNPYLHANATADLPSEQRRAIAAAAERNGELFSAGFILADLDDLSDFNAFMGRHKGNEPLEEFLEATSMPYYVGHLHRTTGQFLAPTLLDGTFGNRTRLAAVGSAGYHGPHFGFLNIFLNQSGLTEESASAAIAYLDALDGGRIDPIARPEDGWLLIYERLVGSLGQDRVDQSLGFFDWPTKTVRHYASLGTKTMAVVIALDGLRPVIGGAETAEPPVLLQDTSRWEEWVAMATLIRDGGMPSVSAEDEAAMVMAVELLVLADRFADVRDLTATLSPDDRTTIFRDLMIRLDRRCDAVTVHPGQALMLGGRTLYKIPAE